MSALSVDVAIVGGGFGGSLLALVLHRAELRVALIDRGSHPRFAIGESSTPIANLVLSDLCHEYDLPRLAPLAKYGSWQRAYPQLGCGIKRGFSYFHHVAGQPFATDAEHSTELLVAASSSDEFSDTHWLRQDVDQFLFEDARVAGVACFEQTEVAEVEPFGNEVTLRLRPLTDKVVEVPRNDSATLELRTRFVVDATGDGRWLQRQLGIEDRSHELHTRSRAIFAHFADLTRWRNCLTARGLDVSDYPFDCDHAALHHVFDGGWMWQLRFNDEVVSVGFVLDEQRSALKPDTSSSFELFHKSTSGERGFRRSEPLRPSLARRASVDAHSSVSDEWDQLLARFPSIAEQFAGAKIVRPESGLIRTGRLQRKLARAVGPWWALLPNTAGFIDPLHSSGIAHTLCGIERLARVLVRHLGRTGLNEQLQRYEAAVLAEVELIDLLVSNCFVAMGEFRVFAAATMLYFAAATNYERARLAASGSFQPAFLLADNVEWRAVVERLSRRVREVMSPARTPPDQRAAALADFEAELAAAIQPFNVVGLCDPSLKNMYRHSALPEP